MGQLVYTGGTYITASSPPSLIAKYFPSLTFYWKFIWCVIRGSSLARQGKYDGAAWSRNCFDVLRSLESVGVAVEIRGIEHVKRLSEPCVFIANHMSMLETVILPAIIQPIKPVTFVIKQSLLEYPVFKHIMRSREPIAVNRRNPRQDLKTVLEEGTARLHKGISVIIFPQTTRTQSFEPAQFNTIGIKLARKADAPVIPLALVTDAWENGTYLKDFGRIDPSKKAVFTFGKPLRVTGRGSQEHTHIIEFIQQSVQEELQQR